MLIRAHPELAGRLAQAGELTRESAMEQAVAGLNFLHVEEIESSANSTRAYREKFGLPFGKIADSRLRDAHLNAAAHSLGCKLAAPFMSLSS